MPQLSPHNKPIDSIFELLGEDENDITYSVGWAMARSRSFLRQFVRETTRYSGDVREAAVRWTPFLTCKTVSEARDLSNKRKDAAKRQEN